MLKLIIKSALIFTLTISNGLAARSIIIDTDVGSDDVLAMTYLLNRPDINIKAITIAADGEAHCDAGFRNVAGLLALTHHNNIPLACGRATPLVGNNAFPDFLRKDADGLTGAADFLPQVSKKPTTDAVALLKKVISESPEPIDIVAIGPLTNIAELITQQPTLKNKIHMIYAMGGAVNVAGNIQALEKKSQNATAEWNFYVDPTATDIVFRSGIPITIVPLDVTNTAPVTLSFYNRMAKEKHSKVGKFVYELFHQNKAEIVNGQWYFWDGLAAVISSDESIVDITSMKLSVKLGSEKVDGTIFIDENNGNNIRVCTKLKNIAQLEKKLTIV